MVNIKIHRHVALATLEKQDRVFVNWEAKVQSMTRESPAAQKFPAEGVADWKETPSCRGGHAPPRSPRQYRLEIALKRRRQELRRIATNEGVTLHRRLSLSPEYRSLDCDDSNFTLIQAHRARQQPIVLINNPYVQPVACETACAVHWLRAHKSDDVMLGSDLT
jgi:hypothetical protein